MSDEEYDFELNEESGDSQSDSDNESVLDNSIIIDVEDINNFKKNYNEYLKTNITSKFLNKYEFTKILSKRCEQLENGCQPLISNFEIYNNVYDIAYEELINKKIPFILKRIINNKYEYFKLEDLHL